MDKNAIKKYAVWARRELISRVTQKALQYGITEKEIQPADASSVNGVVLSAKEKKQRQALIAKIKAENFEQVMEEVAYTWFNRFSALRFMEVNGYLPTHVRVFTDEENNFKPQILAEAINLEIDGLDMEKVYALKDANDNDALFKYLIITQCNALSSILPGMFQKIDDYTELLFPDNLLREGSAVEQMITMIPEEDWRDAVQIIGWLYQYYNAEKKDDVFAALKRNVKITKENIPAATQLFTPDWIVRYMVENSLGRLWLEGHPNDSLKAGWKYYLDEAEQESEVQTQLAKIRKEYEGLKPEDIRCIDPCSGSGHILAYLFDVLVQIYEAYGYTAREAAASIVENNLYGLDIDDRAAQLANFAVMMKARQYDRRFFSRGIQPHVYPIQESNNIQYDKEFGDFLLTEEHRATLCYLLDVFKDAKEYGSILHVEQRNYTGFLEAWETLAESSLENIMMIGWYMEANEVVPTLANQAIALSQKYDVVATNPPYMSVSNGGSNLAKYVLKNYEEGKADLFAVFILCCKRMMKQNGFSALITQHAWMFLGSFEKLRAKLYSCDTVNMAHLGARAFDEISGEVVQTTSFILRNSQFDRYNGVFVRLVSGTNQDDKERLFLSGAEKYVSKLENYSKIPGKPIAYWTSEAMLKAFDNQILYDVARPRQGLATTNNDLFLKLWHEVSIRKTAIGCQTQDAALESGMRWFPVTKGGTFRRWYGNFDYVVNYENSGKLICDYIDNTPGVKVKSNGRVINRDFYFKEGMTWSTIASGPFGMRYVPHGFIFETKGSMCFTSREMLPYLLGLYNSPVIQCFLKMVSPTLDYHEGPLGKTPVIVKLSEKINQLVWGNVELSRIDWDFYETSWDFECHPLITIAKNSMFFDDISNIDLAKCYIAWENECTERFNQLKTNEEELNRIFIDIYGLQEELTPEVDEKDVTVRKANILRDAKSLISYAVGCMFGRYSLNETGLAYAGGEWDASKYKTFPAVKDNIIPICNDEYFEDDVAGRFVKFIEVVYGKRALESNLKFIAETLGGKGQPREVIRNYFINDFYSDHLKIYQKRPIYWLFDSGKKNGFKVLIYMHRYQPDTIARMRTDYVHEQQSRYRTAIADLVKRIDGASTSERVKLNKQLATLQAQASEIHDYEEKIHHLADQYISIDLDDGVKVNYAKFQDVLAKIK